MKNNSVYLCLIFILALILRFLYFPQNTYFGFDQARDAFAVAEIISGNLKITGPPTATGIINHGVLYYYIFTPFYFISGGDPASVSAFLRFFNATGIFLVFLIAYPMFGKLSAFLAAFLFAISYEQTQFSLFLNHPSLAVISVLFFYLGLSIWVFRKKAWGLPLALFGLGLSIQFEFVEIQLIGVFILFALIFRKEVPEINFKNVTFALIALLLPLSSYLLSEIKNNFLITKQLSNFFNSSGFGGSSSLPQILHIINRHFHDNLAGNSIAPAVLAIGFIIILAKLITKGEFRHQLTFLILWFFGGFLVYFVMSNDAYFYNTGTSISLLIFSAFLISKLFSKSKSLALFILLLILFSNISLITKNNPVGPNQKINPQVGLLLRDEKKILDFIYQTAAGGDFAVNALTMPYNVNTTWSYLFEWYGRKKYGYVPLWGGDAAAGFPGKLKVEKARSKLPNTRFLIIEPLDGIPPYLINSFIDNEENYAKTSEKRKIGTMEIWVQQPK